MSTPKLPVFAGYVIAPMSGRRSTTPCSGPTRLLPPWRLIRGASLLDRDYAAVRRVSVLAGGGGAATSQRRPLSNSSRRRAGG